VIHAAMAIVLWPSGITRRWPSSRWLQQPSNSRRPNRSLIATYLLCVPVLTWLVAILVPRVTADIQLVAPQFPRVVAIGLYTPGVIVSICADLGPQGIGVFSCVCCALLVASTRLPRRVAAIASTLVVSTNILTLSIALMAFTTELRGVALVLRMSRAAGMGGD
jgi:hypothetical protein